MYAAVDIGGTKTLVASFTEAGEIIEQVKFPTHEDYEVFVSTLAETIANMSTKEFQAVTVAAPGTIDHSEGVLLHAGNLAWKNVPIQADVEKLFQAPVHLENDAKAATISESRIAGPNYSVVVYITISTGIGVGVCINGNLEKTLLDAEPGWMSIEHDGMMTPWEKVASGKALVARTGKKAFELEDEAAWDYHAKLIAQGLITVLAIVQPDLVVFGGSVGNHLEKFEKPLMKYLKSYENPSVPIPPVRKAAHPEEAVIYGCYELAKDLHK